MKIVETVKTNYIQILSQKINTLQNCINSNANSCT
jgi:hypothetical protein